MSDLAFVDGAPTHFGCVDPADFGKPHVSKNLQEEFDRLRVYTTVFGNFLTELFVASLSSIPTQSVEDVPLVGGEEDAPTSKEAIDVGTNTATMLSSAIKAAAGEGPEAVEKLCEDILEAGKSTLSDGEIARIFTSS